MTDMTDSDGFDTAVIEFLTARISEDEMTAARAIENSWANPDIGGPDTRFGLVVTDDLSCVGVGGHRVMAECQAKRQIVQIAATAYADSPGPDELTILEKTLRALALPYAAHPDYGDTWV